MGKSEDESKPKFRVRDLRGQPKDDEKVEDVSPNQTKETHSPPDDNSEYEGPVDFSTFIVSLSTSALVHMGLVDDPYTKEKTKSLSQARQEVDILGMLEEKTRGNLNPQEKRLLEEILYELRLRFVEATR